MTKSLEDAREELDEEYESFRKGLRKLHDHLEELDRAGPEDDLEAKLEEFESLVKQVRTGGLFGGGAKGHRKALEEYQELTNG
ncbi:MAG: hypothetical protein ABIP21_01430 [Acidimicrobiia bacterium]